jgi:GNAT superfamily N-acetyltransferase
LAPDLRHDPSDEVDAMFVAVIGDDVAGCAAISLLEDATAVLKRLYVKPRRRGAGVARSLVHAAIEYARGQRCRRVVLDTERRRLSAAYRLYVSLGFVECEAYAEVGYASPTFMELRLKADPLDET